jgi:hypothetical protein
MNVLRDYNSRLYEILEIEPRLLSKAQLSRELSKWINTNNYSKTGIIYINDKLNELSDIPVGTEYNEIGDGWWDFTTLVYKKWLRTP